EEPMHVYGRVPVIAAIERRMKDPLTRFVVGVRREVLDVPRVLAHDVRERDACQAGRELFGQHQRIRLRNCVVATSAASTTAKIATRIIAARSHWKRLSAVSSAMPTPPAPTKPSTADSRTLMSQRKRTMPQKAGRTCGQ